jgi:hypothetical protein
MLVNWTAVSTCPVAASRGPRTAWRFAALHSEVVLDEPVPGEATDERVKVTEGGARLADGNTEVAGDEAAPSGDDVRPGVGVAP